MPDHPRRVRWSLCAARVSLVCWCVSNFPQMRQVAAVMAASRRATAARTEARGLVSVIVVIPVLHHVPHEVSRGTGQQPQARTHAQHARPGRHAAPCPPHGRETHAQGTGGTERSDGREAASPARAEARARFKARFRHKDDSGDKTDKSGYRQAPSRISQDFRPKGPGYSAHMPATRRGHISEEVYARTRGRITSGGLAWQS